MCPSAFASRRPETPAFFQLRASVPAIRQLVHSMVLSLINPDMGQSRLPEAERDGGFERDVDDSATDERPSANDSDDHAAPVIEIDDPNLRS